MSTASRSCHLLLVCFIALGLLPAGCGTPTNELKDGDRLAAEYDGDYGQVELLRDRWGVPHIFAQSDAGAMYGLGYVTAQDRAFQMYYNLRIIQGRLAELVGDMKVGASRRLPQGKNSAVRNDVKMRTIGYYRAAERTARHLDPEVRVLLEAYSKGVNDYLDGHPDDLAYLFEKYDLKPEPWTPAAYLTDILQEDDDDGNTNNGTPNWTQICDAFLIHGLECPEVTEYVTIVHTPHGDTVDDQNPYSIVAQITATGDVLNTSDLWLYYQVNDGGWSSLAMTSTGQPDEFSNRGRIER